MPEPLMIYAVQWQDDGEPWGWESLVHTTMESEARQVFTDTLLSVRADFEEAWVSDRARSQNKTVSQIRNDPYTAQVLNRRLSVYRLVSIQVFGELTVPERAKVVNGAWGSTLGVNVIAVGGRG